MSEPRRVPGGEREWHVGRRWIAGIFLVAGSAGVAVGCSDGGEVRAGPDEKRPSSAVLEPGDAIADGFVVADGTTVPGGAFPTAGGTYDGVETPRTWSAVVETDSELPAIVGSYIEQAAELGFSVYGLGDGPVADEVAGSGCSANVMRELEPSENPAGQPPAGAPLWVECRATAERVVGDQLELFEVSAIRSYAAEWGGPSDSFTVGLTRWPSNRGTEPMFPGGFEPPGMPTTALQAPPTVSTLPAVNEGSTILSCNEAITLEPGSRLLGAAFDCSWPSSTLVLEVTGDPEDVFAAYALQIGKAAGFNPPVEEEDASEFDGRSVRVAQISGDDSSYLRITMLSGDDGPTVMSIQQVAG